MMTTTDNGFCMGHDDDDAPVRTYEVRAFNGNAALVPYCTDCVDLARGGASLALDEASYPPDLTSGEPATVELAYQCLRCGWFFTGTEDEHGSITQHGDARKYGDFAEELAEPARALCRKCREAELAFQVRQQERKKHAMFDRALKAVVSAERGICTGAPVEEVVEYLKAAIEVLERR